MKYYPAACHIVMLFSLKTLVSNECTEMSIQQGRGVMGKKGQDSITGARIYMTYIGKFSFSCVGVAKIFHIMA